MSTVSATPQQMRDRLLQAIDSQSNICNMVVVLEVITCLEKYPITKEALEETRLGKLINDVRKKTKDEDLAKRAKKLLRNWQKLIEPGAAVAPSAAPGSTNGSSHPCRTEPTPPDIPVSGKVVPDVKLRNDVHNTYSPKAEKSSRKRRAENRDSGVHLPEKISKMSVYEISSSPPPSNGIMASPDRQEPEVVPSPELLRVEPPDNDKMGRIPVNAVKPRPSSPGMAKLPSTSALIKAAVLQKARLDDSGGGGGGYHQARSPRSVKQDAKCSAPYALDSPLSVPSPSQPPFTDRLPPPPQRSTTPHWSSENSLLDTSHLDSPVVSPSSDQLRPTVSEDTELSVLPNTGHKRRKYRSRDYAVNLDGQKIEDTSKPVRLKERRLTFDPVTGQIKPLVHKEQTHSEESTVSEPEQRTEITAPTPPTAASTAGLIAGSTTQGPNPFQQTNWKELSRNEFIQSYLNLQSNVLTSSGVQAPSAHFFMSEYLKREEKDVVEPRNTHVLEASGPVQQLPGMTRELTDEDMDRIHTQHWPGVNGCRDTKGTWYDWTECITLDPHGDQSRLNILPYVCLD
ncbi:mediator of RNA polymerase II transcription subunit 26 [Eucyclogobius newberryi]|uniref:mediator of RNA polymerase II transcription subunit 26 n=1 Tax=Eucyclogobius newberryi TaxID=166745 RepID=UPI003B599D15